MRLESRYIILLGIGVLLISSTIIFLSGIKNNGEKQSQALSGAQKNISTPATEKPFSSSDISGADPLFRFTATIPNQWQAEYIAGSRAINFYIPPAKASIGLTTQSERLETSQVFIRYFVSDGFVPPASFSVLDSSKSVINGRQAIIYSVLKKSNTPELIGQPSWRNEKHGVTDIRSSGRLPTTFYSFAKSPGLPDDIFKNFLESIRFMPDAKEKALKYPLDHFSERTVKKYFGMFITPENSPVSPERFTGYHTGTDFEILPGEEHKNVFVSSVADGTIVIARSASGYGGVAVIEHSIRGKKVYAVYGHLKVSSILPAGTNVKAGEPFAVLGEGMTEETDFERKHLHFGLYQGGIPDIHGYVQTKDELQDWLDPLDFY